MNTKDAIPNTTKEIRYHIRLNLDGAAMLSFGHAGGGGERKSYHMVMEQLPNKKVEKNGEVI